MTAHGAGIFALSLLLAGCSIFQSRVDDRARLLRTAPAEPVWDLDLYEIACSDPGDSVPDADIFRESGRYYSFKDRVIWSMIEYHLDSLRIATNTRTSWKHLDEWYRVDRPRISDSLYAKYAGAYHRFQGELHFTSDTTWQWLGDTDSFSTCTRSMTLEQLLKLNHWYLFLFDRDGPTHTIPRSHDIQRRVSFYLDSAGQVQHWRSLRRRVKKMRIV
jgi:hypothetical protein